jgi:predicted small metal-binding protein
VLKDKDGYNMRKLLSCREIGCECDYIVTGDTNEEVLGNTAEHSMEKHGKKLEDVMDIQEKMKGFIYSICR